MAVLALLAAGASAADRLPFGLTASRAVLEASLAGRGPSRLLLLGGLDGSPGATQRVRDEIIAVERSRKLAGRFAVTAVAAANPGNAALAFPPQAMPTATSRSLMRCGGSFWLKLRMPW